MTKHVAFLRAINVGGHVVKMEQLRDLFSAMGFAKVETFIASGNVIVEAKSDDTQKLEILIETQLHKSLGYEVSAFLRTLDELRRVEQYRPFSEAELNAKDNALFVGFIAAKPNKNGVQRVEAMRTDVDDLKVHNREVYWLLRASFSDSKISGARLEKALRTKATFRNMNTIRRLIAKYS
jgi:uncharacterized protein (DUF1697 family)